MAKGQVTAQRDEEERAEREFAEQLRQRQEVVKNLNIYDIDGMSQVKGNPSYWDDAVRDFWAETGESTDEVELRIIVKWFDERRKKLAAANKENKPV